MREQELVDIWKKVFQAALDRGESVSALRDSVQKMHASGERAVQQTFSIPQDLMHTYIQAGQSYQKHTDTTVPMEDLQLRALDELEEERDTAEHGSEG